MSCKICSFCYLDRQFRSIEHGLVQCKSDESRRPCIFLERFQHRRDRGTPPLLDLQRLTGHRAGFARDPSKTSRATLRLLIDVIDLNVKISPLDNDELLPIVDGVNQETPP